MLLALPVSCCFGDTDDGACGYGYGGDGFRICDPTRRKLGAEVLRE